MKMCGRGSCSNSLFLSHGVNGVKSHDSTNGSVVHLFGYSREEEIHCPEGAAQKWPWASAHGKRHNISPNDPGGVTLVQSEIVACSGDPSRVGDHKVLG
jgi:hypothetical protein